MRKNNQKSGNLFACFKIMRTFASLLKGSALIKEFWRGGRVVDCGGLENRCTARYPGFESLSLRWLVEFRGCVKIFDTPSFYDNQSKLFRKSRNLFWIKIIYLIFYCFLYDWLLMQLSLKKSGVICG